MKIFGGYDVAAVIETLNKQLCPTDVLFFRNDVDEEKTTKHGQRANFEIEISQASGRWQQTSSNCARE